MTNSLKLLFKKRKDEYINRVVYSVYVVLMGRDNIVLAGRDKDNEKILMIYFIFYLNYLNNKENG